MKRKAKKKRMRKKKKVINRKRELEESLSGEVE